MPTYTYRCPNCERLQVVTHKIAEQPIIKCEHCRNDMIRAITAPGLKFNGNWFKTTGKY